MKKRTLLFSFAVFLSALLLTGCNPSKSENPQTDNLPDNEIVDIIKSFADEVGVDYSNIKENDFDWYNYAEYDYESEDYNAWYYSTTWYWLSVSGLDGLVNITKILDWWSVYYIWDGIWASAAQYSKDNIICTYYEWIEQEIPYELIEWDYENEDEILARDKVRSDFFKTATYQTDIQCGYIPEWSIQLKDFYYNAEWMEPFWFASIRGSFISLFTADWMIDNVYVSNLKYEWENIIFKWYNINWKLEKTNCIDGGKWDNHEYKISFDLIKHLYWKDWMEYDIETTHYEWCADYVEFEFMSWEEWTIDKFSEKTNYVYKWEFNHDNVYYTISDIIDNYVTVYINESDELDSNQYQIIMEKIDDWRKILFEWNWYNISPDECERLNQYDNNLMDMFFLKMCPRW